MTRLGLIACLCAALFVTADAMAARCSGLSNTIFCDDFDRYCENPPADPGTACNCSTAAPYNAGLYEVWIPEGSCPGPSNPHVLVGENSWKCYEPINQGYGLRVFQLDSQGVKVYRHTHNMTARIQAHPNNTMQLSTVNGAGPIEQPLTAQNTIPAGYVDSMSRALRPEALKGQFFMNLEGDGAYANMIFYTELFLDGDRAPTDYQTVYCPAVPNVVGPLKNIQLIRTDGQIHASFAVGVMSIFDPNVCDLDTGWKPSQYRLVVFDGLEWQHFQAPRFDLPLTTPADEADLYPRNGYNIVYFAIGTDYIEVRLSNSESNARFNAGRIPNRYWVARVPRQYKGSFNSVALGPAKGLDLVTPQCAEMPAGMQCVGGANDGQTCTTTDDCPAASEERCLVSLAPNNLMIEEFALYDGVFEAYTTDGACCKVDGSCEILDEGACQGQNGRWDGANSACGEVPCCPQQYGDTDRDFDVDQVDFALLQRCITTGGGTLRPECECLDTDDNEQIDSVDVERFALCGSGPDVQADPGCRSW